MNSTKFECFFLKVYWEQITDDVTARILSCVVTALFALTAILGNGIVTLVIWKTRELHSPSFMLLFCLAASDLLVGIIAQPCFVAYNVAKILDHFSAYCKLRMIQFFCGWITSGVSLLTLSGVCIDRLLALTLHLRYSSLITVPRVVMVIVGVWVICSAGTIIKFWFDKWVILPGIVAVSTLLMIAFCTSKIFQITLKHQRQINVQNQTMINLQRQKNTVNVLKCKKSAETVLYVYGLLLTFYLPFLVVMVLETIKGPTRSVGMAYDYATTVVLINSSINPIIYCWRIKLVRSTVKQHLRRLFFCNKR